MNLNSLLHTFSQSSYISTELSFHSVFLSSVAKLTESSVNMRRTVMAMSTEGGPDRRSGLSTESTIPH